MSEERTTSAEESEPQAPGSAVSEPSPADEGGKTPDEPSESKAQVSPAGTGVPLDRPLSYLVAALSLAISIWVIRASVSMRVATTITITYLPVAGVLLAALGMLRRPFTWPFAVALLLTHLVTLAYSIYHQFMSAR